MDRTEIVEKVQSALSGVLNRDAAGLGEASRLFEDLALDSTGVIELLMELEDAVGMRVDPDELVPEVFRTVGTLADFVQDALAKTPVA